MSSSPVIIYTDGACSGNPGPGGWGAVLIYGEARKEIYGGEPDTTNNRMELMAAIQALKSIKRPSVIELYTDSNYVRNGISQWIHDWKRRGWKTAAKQPVKNVDLWQELDAASGIHTITWHWVKGHNGHPENELADSLACKGVDTVRMRGA